MKYVFIICLLSTSFFSCSQKTQAVSCNDKIDSLYNHYKEHLIFCSYYYEKINTHTGADTIYNYLPFYREEAGIADTLEKDRQILSNMKSYFCRYDAAKIKEIEKWCEVSLYLKKLTKETDFTLDGYMSFLSTNRKTMPLIENYLVGERTIDSFSSNEMENIYYSSIGLIASMKIDEQKQFFEKLLN